MARKDDNEQGHMWAAAAAGIVIGVAVGGLLGLLFAPRPGRETREEIKDRAEQTLDELRDAAGELAERTRELADRTRENVAHSIEAGRDAYLRTRDELTARLDG